MTGVVALVVGAVLALVAVPVAVAGGYLWLLSVLALATARKAAPAAPARRWRFDVLVPAHDEAVGIAETVTSLLAIDYPRALYRVVVIADNCTDDTAARAAAAGATVLERTDDARRGKGYALGWAFGRRLAEADAPDAFVVVDADTVVSANLLDAFAARLEAGAVAAQAHYGVRNPGASWRTRLMTIALALFHRVRSLGREALGVSCGLRGNGMCFKASLLAEVPHDAFSLVEDLEYGIRLGRAGHRVVYANEAEVAGEMVSGEKASRSQRHRWEHGRALMVKQYGWPLLGEGLRARSGLLLDLAMDVLVPPLARLTAATVGLLAVTSAALWWLGAGATAAGLGGFAACGLGFYVMTGWALSGTGLRGLVDLAFAPAYVVWKVTLVLRGGGTKKKEAWVRTTREGEERP